MTIKDIAELAQVSKGTVSKAINGQPGVGKETKERILKLVEKLDFHPNSAAQALAFNKTGNIGLLIPHIAKKNLNGAYWSSMISGIVEKANEKGYNVLLFTTEKEGDVASAYNLLLKRRRVDGLIVGSELLDQKAISALFASEIPFVLLGQNPKINHYYVDVDNYKSSFDMTTYMIDQGYRKIAFLSGPQIYPYNASRKKGYEDAVIKAGLDFVLYKSCSYERMETFKGIAQIVKEGADALFLGAGGDFVFNAIDEFNNLKVKIPQFGFASFDNYPFMDYILPKITTVQQPFSALGSSAVEMLYQILEKGEPDTNPIIHQTTIISRESCGEMISLNKS